MRIFDPSASVVGPYALLYEPGAGFISVTPSDDEPRVVLNFDLLLDIGGYSEPVLTVWVELRNLDISSE